MIRSGSHNFDHNNITPNLPSTNAYEGKHNSDDESITTEFTKGLLQAGSYTV